MDSHDQKSINLSQGTPTEKVEAVNMGQAKVTIAAEPQAEQWIVVESDDCEEQCTDDSSVSSLENQSIYDGVIYEETQEPGKLPLKSQTLYDGVVYEEGGFYDESSHVSGSEYDMIHSVQSISRRLGVIVHPKFADAVVEVVEQFKTDLATTLVPREKEDLDSNATEDASRFRWPFQDDNDSLADEDYDFLEWFLYEHEPNFTA